MVFVTACGYQPLYGTRSSDPVGLKMKDELASVWVEEIPDRAGQLLHNELLTLFNTKGRPRSPRYILKIDYSESYSGLGIGKDEFATRANLYTSAAFVLSGKASFSGNSRSVVNYNILTSPTGTEFAKIDARKRAIRNLAQDIYRRVAIKLQIEQDVQEAN